MVLRLNLLEFTSERRPRLVNTLWIVTISLTVSIQVATATPLIVLSRSLPEGRGVCPGDEITFTCVTNGSASLAWNGDDYIGQDGVQLEFASFDSPGKIARNRASPIGTKATLISKEIEENETQGILESQLNVIVTSDYQNSTIKCLHVDTGYQETTSFQLLGEPDAPQEVEVLKIRDDNIVKDNCVFTLQLSPPSNIHPDDVIYYIDYQSRRDITTSTSYTFIALNCTPEFRVNVTAVNRCGSIGETVIDVVPISSPDTGGAVEAPDTDAGLIAGLVIVIVFAIVIVIIVIVSAVLPCQHCKMNKQQSRDLEQTDGQSHEMRARSHATYDAETGHQGSVKIKPANLRICGCIRVPVEMEKSVIMPLIEEVVSEKLTNKSKDA